MKYLFSIITPTYNRAFSIIKTIESVINQNFADWEMIITDDASNDDTENVIRDYIRKDSRIKYFRFEKNLGPNLARNYAIQHALGEWLVFLDSDDLLTANALEVIADYINKFQNIVFFLFNCKTLDDKIPINIPNYEGPLSYKDFLYSKIKGEALPVVKRDVFLKFQFPINIRGGESIAWINLLKKYPAGYFVNKIVRIYNNKNTDRLSYKKNKDNLKRIYLVHKEFLKSFYKDLLLSPPAMIILLLKLLFYRLRIFMAELIK